MAVPTSVVNGVPHYAASALDASISDIVDALARYRCCVLTDIADACDAWPLLLGAARQVHGAAEEIRYRAWGGFHGTWRGYQPSKDDADAIAAAVDVDPEFVDSAPHRRFSAFEVGAPWPVAAGETSGGLLDTPQPWPDVPGFAAEMSEAFVSALGFGETLVRRLLASPALAAKAFTPRLEAPCSSMRLLRYRAAPTPGEAHLDYELMTLLVSDAPGLEVRDTGGQWRQPEHGPDDLVVMAGDMLEASTRGAIESGLHRVTADRDRHTAVVFVGLDYGVEVLVPAIGKRMPFGQYLEGTMVRTTPHLRSRYEAGTLTLPYPMPEPNPFRGEPWRPN